MSSASCGRGGVLRMLGTRNPAGRAIRRRCDVTRGRGCSVPWRSRRKRCLERPELGAAAGQCRLRRAGVTCRGSPRQAVLASGCLGRGLNVVLPGEMNGQGPPPPSLCLPGAQRQVAVVLRGPPGPALRSCLPQIVSGVADGLGTQAPPTGGPCFPQVTWLGRLWLQTAAGVSLSIVCGSSLVWFFCR